MATYYVESSALAALPADVGRFSVIEVLVDFSEVNDGAGILSTDTLVLCPIPAGCAVIATGWELLTAEGDTATGDVGDGNSSTRYLSNADLNGTPGIQTCATTTPFCYTEDDTIDFDPDHDIDAAVVKFSFVVARMFNNVGVAKL